MPRDRQIEREYGQPIPVRGGRKKGDLLELYVYRFRIQNQLYFLGYIRDERLNVEYLEIGPHKNFYRDLKS